MKSIYRWAPVVYGLALGLACSAQSAGTPASGGNGGASAVGSGGVMGNGGSGEGGSGAGGVVGSGGGTGTGGGAGGSPGTGGADAGTTASDAGGATGGFTCNQVTAMTLTAEWYNAGFESNGGIVNGRWQLKAMEHGYITEWANPNSTFWQTPITSPCTQQSASPDRIVLTVLSWTITTQAEWETQIGLAIDDFKTKYPGVRRIDLITVIRGPGNMLCPTPPAAGETIALPAALDAAIAAVAARMPGFVFAGPKFEAPNCAAFSGGGPHLTSAGNMNMARMIATYFAATQ
jgi:hypothetical protein